MISIISICREEAQWSIVTQIQVSIDEDKGWLKVCNRIDSLPDWMVSNRVRRSSILFSDEKLVYKMDRIDYTTIELVCVWSFFSKVNSWLLWENKSSKEKPEAMRSTDFFFLQERDERRNRSLIYLARSFCWTSCCCRWFNNLLRSLC